MSFVGGDPAKTKLISEAEDPKAGLLEALGDISGIEVLFNHLLVASFIRSTKIGASKLLIRPDSHVDNDQHQTKSGLVVAKGPNAFVSDPHTDFGEQQVEVGDWVAYFVGDGKPLIVNGVHCRVIEDSLIRMKLKDPNLVF